MRIVRTMIISCLSLGLAAGFALAGDKDKDKGGGAGSGSAKAPAGDKDKGDKDKADKADKDKKPAAMEMPKPPAELTDFSKKMAGTWKCTGKVSNPDGTQRDTEGTMQFSVDMDKWWLKSTLTETKTKTPYKAETFVSYDPQSKKWNSVGIDNVGGFRVLTSDGLKDNAVTWTGTMNAMGMKVQLKAVHTMVSDKDVKVDESMSMDGKQWMPTVAVECKK